MKVILTVSGLRKRPTVSHIVTDKLGFGARGKQGKETVATCRRHLSHGYLHIRRAVRLEHHLR
jgi:hypothetical protein